MEVNGTYIDDTEILEYWRMSNAYEASRHKRLQWTAERYSKKHDIPSIRAYKAIDDLLTTRFLHASYGWRE